MHKGPIGIERLHHGEPGGDQVFSCAFSPQRSIWISTIFDPRTLGRHEVDLETGSWGPIVLS